MNLKVRQDASNPFSRSLTILSLGLLADDASQACTLAMPHGVGYARTPGLHVQLARRARRTIVFAEGVDGARTTASYSVSAWTFTECRMPSGPVNETVQARAGT